MEPVIRAQAENTTAVALPANASNTFSRANVFGLFLTLCICLLVQPYGSLFYVKPKNTLGRAIFFFWRLHPVACLLEAVVLVIALLDGVRKSNNEQYLPPEKRMGFWKDMEITIMAATLIRHDRLLVQYKNTSNGSPHQPITARTFPEIVRSRNPPTPSNQFTTMNSTSAGGSKHDATTQPYMRRPSKVEESIGEQTLYYNRVIRDVDPSIHYEIPLERSDHPNAKLTINIINTISVTIVIVKLAAVRIPLYVGIPAWFMVTGWAAVQVLVLALPRQDVSHIEPRHLVSRIVRLQKLSRNDELWLYFTIFLIPIFAFLTGLFIDFSMNFPLRPIFIYPSFWLPYVLFILLFAPALVQDDDPLAVGILSFNLGVAIFLFIRVMIVYDDTDTYKPDWFEWLGS